MPKDQVGINFDKLTQIQSVPTRSFVGEVDGSARTEIMWITAVVFAISALTVHGHVQKRQAFQNRPQGFQNNNGLRGGRQQRQLQALGVQRSIGGFQQQQQLPQNFLQQQKPLFQQQPQLLLSQQQPQLLSQQQQSHLLQQPQQPQIFPQPPSVQRTEFVPFLNQLPQSLQQQQQQSGPQRLGLGGSQRQLQSPLLQQPPIPFPSVQQQQFFGLQPQSFGFEQKPLSGSRKQQPFIQGFGSQPQQQQRRGNSPVDRKPMSQQRQGQGQRFDGNRGQQNNIRAGQQQQTQGNFQQSGGFQQTGPAPPPPPPTQQTTQAPLQPPPPPPQPQQDPPVLQQQPQAQAQTPVPIPLQEQQPTQAPVPAAVQPQDQQAPPPAQPAASPQPQAPQDSANPQPDQLSPPATAQPQGPPATEQPPAAPAAAVPPPQDSVANEVPPPGPPAAPAQPAPPGERRQRDVPQDIPEDNLPHPLIHVEGELSPLHQRERALSKLNVTGAQPAADEFVRQLRNLADLQKSETLPNNPNEPLVNLINSEIDLAVGNWVINEEVAGELALTFGIARESAGRTMLLTPADADEIEIRGNNPTAAKKFKVQIQELLWRKIDQQYRVTTDLLADLSDTLLGLLSGNGIVRERFADDVAAYFYRADKQKIALF